MSDPIVYGFPRSTYVNIVRLILTHKDVDYTFHDLEPLMGKAEHLALHPGDVSEISRVLPMAGANAEPAGDKETVGEPAPA